MVTSYKEGNEGDDEGRPLRNIHHGISSDGSSKNGMVWLWTVDGGLVTSFLTEDYTVDNMFSVAFSPAGGRILTTVRGHADLWDHNERHLARLPCRTNKVKRGLFSPDGQRLVTVGESAIPDVRLWDADGRLIASLTATPLEWSPMLFDAESKSLCIVDNNNAKPWRGNQVVRLWDRDGRHDPFSPLIPAPGTQILLVEFSHDGERILTAASDGTVQLWDIRQGGRLIATFKGHTDRDNTAVFSGDEKRVLTASLDGTARQFLVEVKDLLARAARRAARVLNEGEVARFNVLTPLRFDPTVRVAAV